MNAIIKEGTLDLGHRGLESDEELEALIRGALGGEVAALILSHNKLGPLGAAALLRSAELDGLSGLRELYLDQNDIGDLGLAAIVGSPIVRRLRVLSLSRNKLGTAGAHALARSPFTRGLTELYLDGNALGDEGLRALAASPVLSGVTELWLDWNDIGDQGALALAGSDHVSQLEVISLNRNKISPFGQDALLNARSGRLAKLSVLYADVQDGERVGPSLGRQLVLHFNGRKIPITKDQFIVGRGTKFADLAIKDGNVSRKHVAIIHHGGAYYIKDLGSTCGIECNGMRIDNKRIEEGDVVRIADYELRFTYE